MDDADEAFDVPVFDLAADDFVLALEAPDFADLEPEDFFFIVPVAAAGFVSDAAPFLVAFFLVFFVASFVVSAIFIPLSHISYIDKVKIFTKFIYIRRAGRAA